MFPYNAGEYIKPTFKPLPEGIYKVKIARAKSRENFAKTAKGIGVTYSVTDHQYFGKLIFDDFYIQHENKEFEKQERNRLNGLLAAIKKLILYNPNELEAHPLQIKIKIKKASSDGKFPEKNEVIDYFPFDSNPDEIEDEPKDELKEKVPDNLPF